MRLLLLLLTLPALALADTVTLKNGKVLTGMITEESATVLCLTANGSEWVFSPSEVATIERDAPASVSGANAKSKSTGGGVAVMKLRGASRMRIPRKHKGMRDIEVVDDAPPPPAPVVAAAPAALAPVTYHGPVTVYGTSWCGWCRRTREYFRSRGISFADKDVEKDPSAAQEFAQLRRRHGLDGGVPVIDLGGRIVQGFDRDAIEALVMAR